MSEYQYNYFVTWSDNNFETATDSAAFVDKEEALKYAQKRSEGTSAKFRVVDRLGNVVDTFVMGV